MSAFLAGKSVLIVARKLEDLALLRSLYSGFGASDISVASSANMAINMLRLRRYEYCVVESLLGDDQKTGVQVIEEARREGLTPATSAFLLVTTATAGKQPRDSIEFSADSWISKPLDPNALRRRMEQLVKLKAVVLPVESLIDCGEPKKALALMPKLIARHASLEPYLGRMKGRVLLQRRQYDQGRGHFQRLLDDRDLDWARLGLGICDFHLGAYETALAHFTRLLDRNPDSLEGYEWVSRIHRVMGSNQQAQQILEQGVKALPTAGSLYSELGNVASENSQWEVATKAFRNAVKYAKHSYHQHPNDYFGLARCLQTQLSRSGDAPSALAQQEALRTLEEVVEEYPDDDHIRFRSRLMTSETYQRCGDAVRADSAAKDAFEVYKKLTDDQKAEQLDNLLEGVEATSLKGLVEEFKNDFNRKVYTETEWGRYNLQGLGLYRKGRFYEALCCFEKALQKVDSSSSILLNLVQAGHEVIKHNPERTVEVLVLCNRRWLTLSIGALNSKQQQRYRALSQRRAELLAAQSAADC